MRVGKILKAFFRPRDFAYCALAPCAFCGRRFRLQRLVRLWFWGSSDATLQARYVPCPTSKRGGVREASKRRPRRPCARFRTIQAAVRGFHPKGFVQQGVYIAKPIFEDPSVLAALNHDVNTFAWHPSLIPRPLTLTPKP